MLVAIAVELSTSRTRAGEVAQRDGDTGAPFSSTLPGPSFSNSTR
jgi:hypothetical protein